MEINEKLNCTFVIFGGTGDLTHRKLLPAFYNLAYEGQIPENFALVVIGRKNKTTESYLEEFKKDIQNHSRYSFDSKVYKELMSQIYYYQMDFTNHANYPLLKQFLSLIGTTHQTVGKHIFYLAVAPEFFGQISQNLGQYVLNDQDELNRVVIEKPFGRNLQSARTLNETIVEIFKEDNTYRIDHYLGKEMLQNIMVIRFANTIFEPLWNKEYIDHIQITSSETLGVEKRGGYYEVSGAMRDMLQSHLLQLVSLVAMEPPKDLSPDTVRDEKVKVLKSLRPFCKDTISNFVIRGQYDKGLFEKDLIAYRDEERVSSDSETETFVAIKTFVDNERFDGVPFYIRTGKRLPEKTTEIVVQFKSNPNNPYFKNQNITQNTLVIRIQPQEGVLFVFNAKEPGTQPNIIPVEMDFCQNCRIGINSPEAYERLLLDVIKGDATLFARWDEVEAAWEFIDSIISHWQDETPNFPNYYSNTWGPEAADKLLSDDNRNWIII